MSVAFFGFEPSNISSQICLKTLKNKFEELGLSVTVVTPKMPTRVFLWNYYRNQFISSFMTLEDKKLWSADLIVTKTPFYLGPIMMKFNTLAILADGVCLYDLRPELAELRKKYARDTYLFVKYADEGLKYFANKRTIVAAQHPSYVDFLRRKYGVDVIHLPVFYWKESDLEILRSPVPFEERRVDVAICTAYWKTPEPILRNILKALAKKNLRIVLKYYCTDRVPKSFKELEKIRPEKIKVLDKTMLDRVEYLRSFLMGAKVYVHFSIEETFCVRLVEAMACMPAVTLSNEFWFSSPVKLESIEELPDVVEELATNKMLWREVYERCREESLSYTKEWFMQEINKAVEFLDKKFNLSEIAERRGGAGITKYIFPQK